MMTPAFTATPIYPLPQKIEDQDTIAFDILFNPKTGQRIIERITFSYELSPGTELPRDFDVDDVRLRAVNPVLSIDGKTVLEVKGSTLNSTMLWFYVPGKGRYLMSITSREGYGFEKAGLIQGKQVTVNVDGQTVELRSDVPILYSSGTWNIYILRDASYRMKTGNEQDFAIGATNQIE